MPEAAAQGMFAQLLHAVAYLHDRHVVHRCPLVCEAVSHKAHRCPGAEHGAQGCTGC
jgi:hypothetical protein